MREGEVQLFPAWRQAVQDFLSAEFREGDVVPHAWLERHFGIEPVGERALTLQEHQERQFEWLRSVEAFKSELLEGHQIMLASIPGEGYRWVPPHEQTRLAVDKFEKDARRAYRHAGLRLTHIRVGVLSDEQRRENADAIGRLTMLQGMHRQIE